MTAGWAGYQLLGRSKQLLRDMTAEMEAGGEALGLSRRPS